MSKLILLRHGQSLWNLENRFTGWKDIGLTDQGIQEAQYAGKIMKKNDIQIDIIFSSKLIRANETAKIAISSMNLDHLWDKKKQLIFIKNKSLNERDYGNLVGLNKKQTEDKFGKEKVHLWRRSYDIRPPGGESLKDVIERVRPYYKNKILPEINYEKNILVVAHGNSLRAMMIIIGLYSSQEISKIEIPTGSPFVINFENGKVIHYKYID